MNLIEVVESVHSNKRVKLMPDFRPGDTIAVFAKVTEGSKSRTQVFQGMVIAIKKRGAMNGTFTVRKFTDGTGVERLFPFHSPNIEKVDIIQRGKSKRAKLYFLRDRSGKGARLDIDYERKDLGLEVSAETAMAEKEYREMKEKEKQEKALAHKEPKEKKPKAAKKPTK